MEQLSRRDFSIGAAATLVRAYIAPGIPEWLSSPEIKRTFELFGLHGAPVPGGGINRDITLQDFQRLGVRSTVLIAPDRDFLQALTNADIAVISRAYQQNNRFDREYLDKMLTTVSSVVKQPIIVPYNEVNLRRETGGERISPQDHMMKDFLPATRMIAEAGGISLLTPLAKRAPENEDQYLDTMLNVAKQIISKEPHLIPHLGIAIHPYIFNPGENPWLYASAVHRMAQKKLGFPLPIYATESELHQSRYRRFSDEVVATETRRLIHLPIPQELRNIVKTFDVWLHANGAVREKAPNHKPTEDVWDDFELSAFRASRDSVKPVFTTVENYHLQFNKLSLNP